MTGTIRFKLTNEIISQIKEMPSLKLWLAEENQKVMKDNNLELIITNPYIREIPKYRDEVFAKTREAINVASNNSKRKKLKIFK